MSPGTIILALIIELILARDDLFGDVELSCPEMDECPLNCMFGYLVSEDGCEVCECQNEPCPENGGECRYPIKHIKEEKECHETNTCNVMSIPGVCPDVTCQSFCTFGLAKGRSGCPICKCNPNPCTAKPCASEFVCIPTDYGCDRNACQWRSKCFPICQKFECPLKCKFGYRKDTNECYTCKCKKNYCEKIKCPANQVCVQDLRTKDLYKCVCSLKTYNDPVCAYGLARDENGCKTKKCAKNPCQFVECQKGSLCILIQEESCLESPCPYKAKCL